MEFVFHPAMCHVVLGWHAIEFAQTSGVLDFYFRFRFRPYHRSRHIILYQCAKFYPNRTADGRKMTSRRFSRWLTSAILDFRGPIMGFLKSPCTTSYRSSTETIALNCLVFEKITFLHFATRSKMADLQIFAVKWQNLCLRGENGQPDSLSWPRNLVTPKDIATKRAERRTGTQQLYHCANFHADRCITVAEIPRAVQKIQTQ